MNKSLVRDSRYYMKDNYTSYGSPTPFDVCIRVVIWVRVERNRFADGKYLAKAKLRRTNYNGGSHMIAVGCIWFNNAVCKVACHQQDVGKYNSMVGHANDWILLMRDSARPL